jgi:hypothetical protein
MGVTVFIITEVISWASPNSPVTRNRCGYTWYYLLSSKAS